MLAHYLNRCPSQARQAIASRITIQNATSVSRRSLVQQQLLNQRRPLVVTTASSVAAFGTCTSSTVDQNGSRSGFAAAAAAIASGIVGGAAFGTDNNYVCDCEKNSSGINPAAVPPLNNENEYVEIDDDKLPIIRMSEVEQHNGQQQKTQQENDNENGQIWMTYGGYVYNVTDFIANHPGGSEKIMLAAGGPIEPHWHLYRQHFASDLPLRLMEKLLIGKLHPTDQDAIDTLMDSIGTSGDPYEHEPIDERHPLLHVHSDTPMNAEVPSMVLNREYLTPVDLFYIRHHHPVPLLGEEDVERFRLEVDLKLLLGGSDGDASCDSGGSGEGRKGQSTAKLSLEQIKSLPKVEVTTTLQCSGNRRSGFNDLRRTSGTPWGQGAISTAKWGGARLVDVLMLAADQIAAAEKVRGKDDKDNTNTKSFSTSSEGEQKEQQQPPPLLQSLQNLHTILSQNPKLQHLRFESLDGMHASIDILKALSPFGDVILAYEMNGEALPRDHGYPLRAIVPGYAAVRNVKWLSKLELAEEQAEGAWQRGLNYKVLPPSVVDAKGVNLDAMPGLGEVSVFSGITDVTNAGGGMTKMEPAQKVLVKASGWAWAGGGRNIVRVDVTGDSGKSWEAATITQGSTQPYGRAWAWVFWECNGIPATVCEDGCSVELCCKGVDLAFNTQPESSDGLWNVRGLANNSWFRLRHKVAENE